MERFLAFNEISVIIEPIAVLRQNAVREERSREMSRIAPLAIIAFFLLVIPAFPADSPDVSVAKDVAKTWLSLTDSGKYAESWDAASKSFKKAITKPIGLRTSNRLDPHLAQLSPGIWKAPHLHENFLTPLMASMS